MCSKMYSEWNSDKDFKKKYIWEEKNVCIEGMDDAEILNRVVLKALSLIFAGLGVRIPVESTYHIYKYSKIINPNNKLLIKIHFILLIWNISS